MQYRQNRGTWMSDLGLNVLAIPYILAGRLLTGSPTFELHGFEPVGLVVAALFCASLLYFVGDLIERVVRWSKKVGDPR